MVLGLSIIEIKIMYVLTVVILSEEHRDLFFRDLLTHVVPSEVDEFADLFQRSVALNTGVSSDSDSNNAESFPAPHVSQQLAFFFAEFRRWSDEARNGFMNQLEMVDLARVYRFYEDFAQLRWR